MKSESCVIGGVIVSKRSIPDGLYEEIITANLHEALSAQAWKLAKNIEKLDCQTRIFVRKLAQSATN